jgi:ribosomal protein S18 acetylase RimI-like enzyme
MIRPYKDSDKNELIKILELNTPLYFDVLEINDFKEYLDQHSDTYFTVEQDDKIVGGIGYNISENNTIGHITWQFFHPDSAGHGLGNLCVEHCLNILKSNRDLKKSIVTTSQMAFKFFEKFGYKLIRTEEDHWGAGFDLYLMELELTN